MLFQHYNFNQLVLSTNYNLNKDGFETGKSMTVFQPFNTMTSRAEGWSRFGKEG
jgi:hypothetical protein